MVSIVKPTNEQVAWQDLEFGIFVHFGMNTFNNKEWSDGTCDVTSFNPSHLDCEQWVQTAKGVGAQYMVLVCKHHDGFCLWQTETTEYSVKNSPYKNGKGDVVAEFVAACRKFNMKFGFYLSPWDRHEPKYPDKAAYDQFYATQLTELVTKYAKHDEIFELWFDGAGSTGRFYNWELFMGIVHKHQPSVMIFNMGDLTIRWVGNEHGVAPYPHWNVIDTHLAEKSKDGNVKNDGSGDKWIPAECDVPIHLRHWFHHKKMWGIAYRFALLSLDRLMDIYEKSVGHGANLLLNIAPTEEGRFSARDIKRANELGQEVKRRYAVPLGEASGNGNTVILTLPDGKSVNAFIIEEDIREGERVRKYHLEAHLNGQWQSLKTIEPNISIGHKKIDKLDLPIRTREIKLIIDEAIAEPLIRNFRTFSF